MVEENGRSKTTQPGPDDKVECVQTARVPLLSRMQGSTLRVLEEGFEWYGVLVASHPLQVIAACLALTLLCGGGLYWFRAENEGGVVNLMTSSRSSSTQL